jgi:hypothetical protein
METFEIVIEIVKKIENEDLAMEQARLDEVKSFVYV